MSALWLRRPGFIVACNHLLQKSRLLLHLHHQLIIPTFRNSHGHSLARIIKFPTFLQYSNRIKHLNFRTTAQHAGNLQDSRPSPKDFSDNNDSSISEIGDSALSLLEFEDLRMVLYPDHTDALTVALSQATSVIEVFDLVRHPNLDPRQASQALVTLWDLQKLYCHFRTAYSHLSYNHHVEEYTKSIKQHAQFPELINNVLKHTWSYNEEALPCILLCLRRFGFNVWEVPMYPLVEAALAKLDSFPITALSRFCLAIRDQLGPGRLAIAAVVPRLLHFLDRCSNEECLKLTTVGLLSTSHVSANDVLPKYLAVVRRLLDEGKLDNASTSTVIRVLRLLAHPAGVGQANAVASRLLTIAKPSIDKCSYIEIVWLSKVMETFQEPRDVVSKVEQVACRALEGRNLEIRHLDLLACIVPTTSVEGRTRLEKIVSGIIVETPFNELKPHFPALHRILRGLKVSERQIINTFWSKLFACVEMNDSVEGVLLLARACHWYMYFNNNLGGTYRFPSFEQNVVYRIQGFTESGRYIPRQTWCRLSAFVIAYSNNELPAWVTPRLFELAPRFTVAECSIISRSLQIALGFHTKFLPLNLARSLVHMNHLLDSATATCLTKESGGGDAIALLRSYTVRRDRTTVTDLLLNKLYDKCLRDIHQHGLHSRMIKDLVSVLTTNNTLHKDMIETMARYVVQHREAVPVLVVERLFNLCYQLGYLPGPGEAFLAAGAQILSQQYEHVQGLGLVQSLLYLMLFQQLPDSLVRIVFSVPFMDKLDEEISCCYSKATYPFKVRHALMELNRSVCIDMPEADVPWFHDKFCQEQIVSNSPRRTPFHNEIEQCLHQILGGKRFLRVNGFSPYYHYLDFELLLNKEGNPQEVPSNPSLFGPRFAQPIPETWERIVVQTLPTEAYSNHARSLGGSHKLHLRHLEMLGYRVVPLPVHLWNSLPLSSMDAKISYLRKQIFKSTG